MTSFVLFELINKTLEDRYDFDTLQIRREFIILFMPSLKFNDSSKVFIVTYIV